MFTEDHIRKGYNVKEIAHGVYWVTSGWYDCMFIRTGNGVVAVDAPPALGENLLSVIEEVTDEPVTHMIYSHWHADHVGASSIFGSKIKRTFMTCWAWRAKALETIPVQYFTGQLTGKQRATSAGQKRTTSARVSIG